MARGAGKLTGFREASRQLNGMKKSVAQGVGRRALQVPAAILRDEMKVRVSKKTGATEASTVIGKERARKGRPQVNVTVEDIASVQLEYGNLRMAAEPFARPAQEAKQDQMLSAFGEALKSEVDSTVIKQAKRDAAGGSGR
jgi:HK97 gp10 family phage protein